MKQISVERNKMPESGIRKLQNLASAIPEAIKILLFAISLEQKET